MRVLLCHNRYLQRGGEDQVFEDERWLLEREGHSVRAYVRDNRELDRRGHVRNGFSAIWNQRTYRDVRAIAKEFQPHILHCTNTFPIVSPAIYYAAKASGAAVVQTLHNYRLFCPGATLLRDRQVCELCISKRFAWPGIRHRCYRDNVAATAVVAATHALHRAIGTYHRKVDRYIALTEFSRQKFIEAGLPSERICVKPNFVHPAPEPGEDRRSGAVFVGRLAPEKGIEVLLEAWTRHGVDVPLTIIGTGPLDETVSAAAQHPQITWLGNQPFESVLQVLRRSQFLVMPSIWYETFGRTTIEAFAAATPVIASRLGAMADLIDDGTTGLLFAPGDADSLAQAARRLSNDGTAIQMGRAARLEFERRFTAEINYRELISVYESAVDAGKSRAL